jgi:hypothetical protein
MRVVRERGCRRPNTALQLTASRARSLLFGRWSTVRSRQLNAKPLGGTQSYRCLVLQGCSLVLWRTNAVLLRSNQSSVGCRPVVLGVVPCSTF